MFALVAVREAVDAIRAAGRAVVAEPVRVLLAGRTSREQRAWVGQHIAGDGVQVAYPDPAAQDAALVDPAAALSAEDQWIPVTAAVDAAPAGPGQPVLFPAGMRLLAPSAVGDPRAEPWNLAELRDLLQGGSGDQRGVWFTGAGQAADALFQAQAEQLVVGAGDLVVHLEGRDGIVYHAGRPVPVGVLVDLLADVPVGFGRVVVLVCQAGLGELAERLPALLTDRLGRAITVLVSDDLVAVSVANGTAVAVTVGYGAEGRPQPQASAFHQVPDDPDDPGHRPGPDDPAGPDDAAGPDGGVSSIPAGATYPPGVNISADAGPFSLRALPGPGAPV